jgi:Raf kinase inhibitor-like YbhB/YbcL family protein
MTFRLTSMDFRDGDVLPQAQVFNGMGHSGGNLSPQLSWDGVPEGTQSFVVTCYDPDAPTGSGWWHWVVTDLPADTRELEQGAGGGLARLPSPALQTRTDFGPPGYGGAAPPPGPPHRYIFTVHALKIPSIGVGVDASPAFVGFNVHFNVLGSASLTALYGA